MDQEEMTLRSQILMQMSECRLMPFKRFRTVPSLAMRLEIVLNRSFHCQALAFLSGRRLRCRSDGDGGGEPDDLTWFALR